MAKSPHTPEFRAMVSQKYLDGLGSYDFLANKYQIGSKTIKQWVAKYRLYGLLAFQNKKGNASYSSDFKTMCVEAVLFGAGSVDDIVAKYNISSRQVLRNWISMYNANRELKDYDPKREVYMAQARRKTTIEEHKEIVKYCIGHNRNYKDTADLFDVSYSQVYSWVKKYDANKEAGLSDQLVILDMQMAGMGGYETAQRLREKDKGAVIAFVSGVILPEPGHFRVQLYRYLLKNSDADERMRDIEELLLETERGSRNEMAEVVSDGEAQRVPVGSILYIEKAKRGSLLTVEASGTVGRKTLQSNERLEEWYAQLCAQGFEYAHTSYIVNLKAVTKIMQNELTMSNGNKLGISRTCSKKFHQSFSMYFHKKYKR